MYTYVKGKGWLPEPPVRYVKYKRDMKKNWEAICKNCNKRAEDHYYAIAGTWEQDTLSCPNFPNDGLFPAED